MKPKYYCPDCMARLDPMDDDEESGFYVCPDCGWEGIFDADGEEE